MSAIHSAAKNCSNIHPAHTHDATCAQSCCLFFFLSAKSTACRRASFLCSHVTGFLHFGYCISLFVCYQVLLSSAIMDGLLIEWETAVIGYCSLLISVVDRVCIFSQIIRNYATYILWYGKAEIPCSMFMFFLLTSSLFEILLVENRITQSNCEPSQPPPLSSDKLKRNCSQITPRSIIILILIEHLRPARARRIGT